MEELGASIRVTGPNCSGGAWDKSGVINSQSSEHPEPPPLVEPSTAVEPTDDVDDESHVIAAGSQQAGPVEEAAPPPALPALNQVTSIVCIAASVCWGLWFWWGFIVLIIAANPKFGNISIYCDYD